MGIDPEDNFVEKVTDEGLEPPAFGSGIQRAAIAP